MLWTAVCVGSDVAGGGAEAAMDIVSGRVVGGVWRGVARMRARAARGPGARESAHHSVARRSARSIPGARNKRLQTKNERTFNVT